MFREKLTTLPYIEDNPFEYNDDFESVMQFIKNNKTIRKKLEEYKESEKAQNNIKELKNAIKKGDLNNQIFRQYDCELYALYLLKENKISIVDYATINIYLEALMHAGIQAVKFEDEQYIQDKLEITIGALNNNIKSLIKNKLKSLWFNKYSYTKFDENELDEHFNNLKDLDKNIIVIKKPEEHKKSTAEISLDHIKFLEEVFLYSPCVVDDKNYYYIPTVGMMNLILQAVLFGIASGPIKGFAITTMIGILTSMFTAVTFTRGMVNLIYGGKKIEKLSIGI